MWLMGEEWLRVDILLRELTEKFMLATTLSDFINHREWWTRPNIQDDEESAFCITSEEVMGMIRDLWNHPTGPKTIFFWAPVAKWGISFANIADFSKPPETISYPYQSAMAGSALIWCRYSMVIIPKNWNLLTVNTLMVMTSSYQLYRKMWHEKERENKRQRRGNS